MIPDAPLLPSATWEAIARLVAVGVVWMSVHCAGMCGPLLIGLDVAGLQRGASAARGAFRMLAYQGGRAMTYAVLGGVAGLAGTGLDSLSKNLGAGLAVLLGVLAAARAVVLLLPRRARLIRIGTARRRRLDVAELVTRLATPVVSSCHPARPALLGAVLGFMPCMIALWALGLAATAGSALGGALVMFALVVMTTPVVVAIGSFVRLFARIPPAWRGAVSHVLLLGSGVLLILVGLAGAGWIDHLHLALGRYTVMVY